MRRRRTWRRLHRSGARERKHRNEKSDMNHLHGTEDIYKLAKRKESFPAVRRAQIYKRESSAISTHIYLRKLTRQKLSIACRIVYCVSYIFKQIETTCTRNHQAGLSISSFCKKRRKRTENVSHLYRKHLSHRPAGLTGVVPFPHSHFRSIFDAEKYGHRHVRKIVFRKCWLA